MNQIIMNFLLSVLIKNVNLKFSEIDCKNCGSNFSP